MKLTIKDIYIKITDKTKACNKANYHTIKDFKNFLLLPEKSKNRKIIIIINQPSEVDPIFDDLKLFLKGRKKNVLEKIIIYTNTLEEVINRVKKQFIIVKAAGGVVFKKEDILFIHRLGKWDLPKGKMDENEVFRETAKREVEEECSITVQVEEKICTTYHTYYKASQYTLKETRWYRMRCIDDSMMKPQIKEKIDNLEWVAPLDWESKLQDTHRSIKLVMKKLQEKTS